jgi:hypothetical protein
MGAARGNPVNATELPTVSMLVDVDELLGACAH